MIPAIHAEFRKVFTTRIWWLLTFVMIAYLGFIALIMAAAFVLGGDEMTGGGGPQMGKQLAHMLYSLAGPIGYVFPLVIGSLLFTTEFRHKTITSSLLVAPNRTNLLIGKIVVAATVGLLYGIVAIGSVVAVAAPFLEILGDGAFLGEKETWEIFLGTVWVYVLWSMLGVVLGGLIVNQVAAIIILLVMTQLVEPVLSLLPLFWEPAEHVVKFLPAASGTSVIGGSSLDMGMGMSAELGRIEGTFVLLAYVAVFAVAARLITLRRDIG